jgi:sec-independent protein translocase protein TatB
MPLLVFEFLGTTELLVIALVALIIFGPRKLPEIGRTIGKGMAEFKRASEDFKRTWEYEVEVERQKTPEEPQEPEEPAAHPQLLEEGETTSLAEWEPPPEDDAAAGETVARSPAYGDAATRPPDDGSEPAADAAAREHERV